MTPDQFANGVEQWASVIGGAVITVAVIAWAAWTIVSSLFGGDE